MEGTVEMPTIPFCVLEGAKVPGRIDRERGSGRSRVVERIDHANITDDSTGQQPTTLVG